MGWNWRVRLEPILLSSSYSHFFMMSAVLQIVVILRTALELLASWNRCKAEKYR